MPVPVRLQTSCTLEPYGHTVDSFHFFPTAVGNSRMTPRPDCQLDHCHWRERVDREPQKVLPAAECPGPRCRAKSGCAAAPHTLCHTKRSSANAHCALRHKVAPTLAKTALCRPEWHCRHVCPLLACEWCSHGCHSYSRAQSWSARRARYTTRGEAQSPLRVLHFGRPNGVSARVRGTPRD